MIPATKNFVTTERFRRALAGAGLALALSLSACGGGGSSDATPSLQLLTGTLGGEGNLDGTGTSARFNNPAGTAVDASGNVYVADRTNSFIRKITPAGSTSTIANTAENSGSVPTGVAVDAGGNIYVSTSDNVIRKMTPSGVVSTLAGTPGKTGTADGTGADARFSSPKGIAVDAAGNLYVADSNNHVIRKVTPAGGVSTLAGVPGFRAYVDGNAAEAQFRDPNGVAVDAAGNVYVADSGNMVIRKITPAGVVSTLAGLAGNSEFADGVGAAARFSFPAGIAIDAAGNLYVADVPGIRKITPSATVTTIARDAPQTIIALGVAVDAAGNLYVAAATDVISKITPAGTISTLAGMSSSSQPITLSNSVGVTTDAAGNFYVANAANILKVTPTGAVSTLAGGNSVSFGSANGTGSAASFNYASGVVADAAGNLYVADTFNHLIRKITPAGVVSTLAGSAGAFGYADGTGIGAQFNSPTGIAIDTAGTLYVADRGNQLIRKVTQAGVVTTLAGKVPVGPETPPGAIGPPVTVVPGPFGSPTGVAVDASGNVYVADYSYHVIHKVSPAGAVSTLAGASRSAGNVDGVGAAARFNSPTGVAVDAGGTVYVTDTGNNAIRKITASGTVSTYVGPTATATIPFNQNVLSLPKGVAVTSKGLVITSENALLLVQP
ncbi:hypothetical protein BH11PSE11_BH11PSE11_13340 [soil metagenome]